MNPERIFDVISSWFACQSDWQRAASIAIINQARDLFTYIPRNELESAWSGAGGDVSSFQWNLYLHVHTLEPGILTLPGGEELEVYFWTPSYWLTIASWYDTPGVNRDVCVQRLYPDSPLGLTKFPPDNQEDT